MNKYGIKKVNIHVPLKGKQLTPEQITEREARMELLNGAVRGIGVCIQHYILTEV